MKILVLLIAVYALWWLLRRSFAGSRGARPRTPGAAPETMLACSYCGIHLPRDEALPGRGGVFCGEPHRAAFEQANPAP